MADKKLTSTFTTPESRTGSPVAPNPNGVAQTTIDTKTTTVNPESSVLNPVNPDGSDAPEIKHAVLPANTTAPGTTAPGTTAPSPAPGTTAPGATPATPGTPVSPSSPGTTSPPSR